MDDEEAYFEIWFQLHRKKTFELGHRDAGDTLDKHPHWGMGFRSAHLEGWMARASLHVTPACFANDAKGDK